MSYRVRLIACGSKKISVIKTVREFTGLSLKVAKNLVDRAPVDFPKLYDLETARRICEELQENPGAMAEVQGVNGAHVRIACRVDKNGKAFCMGWENAKDDDLKADSAFWESDLDSDAHWVFLEAVLPLPRPDMEAEAKIAKVEP